MISFWSLKGKIHRLCKQEQRKFSLLVESCNPVTRIGEISPVRVQQPRIMIHNILLTVQTRTGEISSVRVQ